MTIAAPKNIALQACLQLPYIEESPAWEYINGEGVQKPVGGGSHSLLQKGLITTIDQSETRCKAFPELHLWRSFHRARCSRGQKPIATR